MKWNYPQCFDERTIRKFLWKPLKINGECRWLESATIKQTYVVTIWGNYWRDDYFV